ncbi:MAG: LytR family transcriptional regulator [Ruminococcaceae bacterium]|nr:LytR family transcriptional regulator [Oscillospiraceae bacterium]
MLASLRNFVITFVIALLIFAPTAYVLTDLLIECVGPGFGIIAPEDQGTDNKPATDTTDNFTNTDTPVTTNGTSFNMLIVGTDYQPGILNDYKADAFANYPMFKDAAGLDPNGSMSDYTAYRTINADTMIFIRADKANQRFIYSYIPPEMLVMCGGVEMTLSEAYTTLGIDYLTSKITAITGFYVDYYTIIDMSGVEVLINSLEGLTVSVPCNMRYSDPAQNLLIDLKAGAQKLNGKKCLDLIRYNGYTNDMSFDRGTVTMSVLNALAEKLASESAISKISSIYTTVTNYATTNFSAADVAEHTDLLTDYASYKKLNISYPGSYETHNGRKVFLPNTNKAILNYSEYR